MLLRFFSPNLPPVGERFELRGEEFHHARVTRVTEGEEVEIFDGQGRIVKAKPIKVTSEGMLVDILEDCPSRESPLRIELAVSLIQPEKFELVLQKTTELGVSLIIPLATERSEIRPERVRSKQERWKKILMEAAKQSGRSTIPGLDSLTKFDDALIPNRIHFFYDGDTPPTSTPALFSTLRLFIGPEGGWSESELAKAHAANVVFQQLGPRRLRAETAAITAVALVAARYGDLSSG